MNQNYGTATGLRYYVDPETLFTLEIPVGWVIDTSGQQGSKVILFHPEAESGFRTNVNVVIQELGPLTKDEYLTLSRLQLKQLTGKSKLGVDEPAQQPAGGHIFEWSLHRPEMGPAPLRAKQLVFIDGTKAYVVTGTALLSQFESHRREFETVLESFHIKKAEAR